MQRFLVFVAVALWVPNYVLADILDDASKYTVQVRTSIEHAFAEDEAGTIYGAGFLVDADNRYIVTNAHVSGRGNEPCIRSLSAPALFCSPHTRG